MRYLEFIAKMFNDSPRDACNERATNVGDNALQPVVSQVALLLSCDTNSIRPDDVEISKIISDRLEETHWAKTAGLTKICG